jgi:HSP20 family protein
MSILSRRDRGTDPASRRFARMDRVFEEWMRSLPMRRPFGLGWDWPGEDLIRIDEYRDGDVQVVRAELPGVDPQRDIEVTVTGGVLRINAERRTEQEDERKGYTRHEIHRGTLTRSIPLAEGVDPSSVTAAYRNGILEVRVPVPEQGPAAEPTRIAVTTA